MKNPLWSAVYDLMQEVDSLLSRSERFGGEGGAPSAPPAAEGGGGGEAPAAAAEGGESAPQQRKKKGMFFKAYVATDDLVEVRSKVRSKLDLLKAQLSEHLNERETYLVLFPLVVMLDELVQNRFSGAGGQWPSLQAELFKIEDGGEVFYNTIDDIIRKPDTLPFVYEVFYLCLNQGFKGRYSDNQAKINEYKHRLEAKIPFPPIPREEKEDARTVLSFASVPFGRYAIAGAVLVVAYVALRVAADYMLRA